MHPLLNPKNLLLAAGACLAGCTVGPDYKTPATPVPPAFVAAAAEPAKAVKPSIDLANWWHSFNDPELDSLVKRAIASSLDIEIALTRLQEARTAEAVVFGQALPFADVSAGAGKGTGTNSTRGRVAPPLNAATNTTGLKEITHVVGFDAGWELDLFGKYRRAMEAAKYDAQAAAEARNAVLIAVVADVVQGYMDLRGLQMRLAVARQNVELARRTLEVVETRFNRGLTNELDLALARRQYATLRANLAPLLAQSNAAQYAIAVLLGKFPEDLSNELAAPGVIPPLPQEIEAGLPLDLLRRRPDIREAERELAAETARIGVATADLFPRLSLTGGAGFQGQGLGKNPVTNSFIWSLGPSAYWPFLDFGTLDALVDIQDLRTHERLVGYKQTVLAAVESVDSAIANYRAQADRLLRLGDALVASQRAVTLASERYERGLTDFLNVLDAQRQEYDLEDQYAVAQQAAADQFVALYKGLGGGWEQFQTTPPIRQPQPAILAAFRRLLAPSQDGDRPAPAK